MTETFGICCKGMGKIGREVICMKYPPKHNIEAQQQEEVNEMAISLETQVERVRN